MQGYYRLVEKSTFVARLLIGGLPCFDKSKALVPFTYWPKILGEPRRRKGGNEGLATTTLF